MFKATAIATLCLLGACSSLESMLDAPVQVVDPETAEPSTVPLGDVVADNAEQVSGAVGDAVGLFNPILGLMAAGAVGTLLAGARRKQPGTA